MYAPTVKEPANKNNYDSVVSSGADLQRKLAIGEVNDPLKAEAVAKADRSIYMPEPAVPIPIHHKFGGSIQKQDDPATITAGKVMPDTPQFAPQLTQPDFLSLRTPFFERNAVHLWDFKSAIGVWKYSHDFFKRLGLSDSWAGKAANFTAPFAIDAQLKAANPKWWEITDRELQTTSIVGSFPLFDFDADFKNWKLLPFLQKKALSAASPTVQRKCAECEEEERRGQLKPIAAQISSFIQTKSFEKSVSLSEAVATGIEATRGGGSPLPEATRSFMESRFGTDFSAVRVHTSAAAADMSRSLSARAFTAGDDIYFGAGNFQPETSEGQRLLAHELAHTLQQASVRKDIQRNCGPEAIGSSEGCIGNSMQIPARPRYLFNVGCDDFLEGNELDLRADAASIRNDEEIELHGLASEEGPVEFNLQLSCARALRARAVIEEVLRTQGVTARIAVFSHGPQPGGRAVNRSVAVIRRSTPPPARDDETPSAIPHCSGIYTDGRDETLNGDHDLDQGHHSGEGSPDIIFYDTIGGENGAHTDYWTGFFGGTMFESSRDDDALYDHFMTGSGARMNFSPASDMASIIGQSPSFTSFADVFERSVLAHISSTGTLCGFDGNTCLATNRPAYFHSPLFAWAVMGGYARIDASVTQPTGGSITVRYKIFDHYGAGVRDAWSYLLGLPAMYYLQHFHGAWGLKYTPYIWSVEISRTRP